MATRRRSIVVLLAVAVVNACAASPTTPASAPSAGTQVRVGPDTVIAWNAIAQRSAITNAKQFQTQSMVYISYVQAAVYDAVVAIGGRYKPYAKSLPARAGTSMDAAVAQAAHDVLVRYFVSQSADLDADLAKSLDAIPEGASKSDGITLGRDAAEAVFARRAGDGIEADIGFAVPKVTPGVWQPPAGQGPQTPWVAKMRPFTLDKADQFRPAPFPALTSPEWAEMFNEVKSMGGSNSTARTAEQTDIARFWSTNAIVQYNTAFKSIAQSRGLDAVDTARLYAMGNIVGVDALIACFDAKYFYLNWRPQYAIPQGDADGNPATAGDPAWTPLLATPNHPEYPAAHGCLTGAEARVFTAFLGTDRINLELTSTVQGLQATTRHYNTADELTTEVTNARVWGGLHYRKSATEGLEIARKVATLSLTRFFTPKSP